jgi:hypothetical protein
VAREYVGAGYMVPAERTRVGGAGLELFRAAQRTGGRDERHASARGEWWWESHRGQRRERFHARQWRWIAALAPCTAARDATADELSRLRRDRKKMAFEMPPSCASGHARGRSTDGLGCHPAEGRTTMTDRDKNSSGSSNIDRGGMSGASGRSGSSESRSGSGAGFSGSKGASDRSTDGLTGSSASGGSVGQSASQNRSQPGSQRQAQSGSQSGSRSSSPRGSQDGGGMKRSASSGSDQLEGDISRSGQSGQGGRSGMSGSPSDSRHAGGSRGASSGPGSSGGSGGSR